LAAILIQKQVEEMAALYHGKMLLLQGLICIGEYGYEFD
jgi:hypothetical protein